MKNLIRTAFIAVLLLASSAITAQQSESIKIDHGPFLQNVSENQVSIVFSTNKLVIPGVVLYEEGKDPREIKNSRDGLIDVGAGVHKVKIKNLKPGTTYRYKAFGVEVSEYKAYRSTFGDTVFSSENTFTTFDPYKENICFTVFNDVHDRASKIANYTDLQNVKDQDFYVLNGDIMGHIDNEAQIYSSFVDTCVNRFASNIPFFFVRGNHETRGSFARELKNYLALENDSYYYAFTHGPARFVVLDGGEDKPDDNIEYSGLVDFDSYRSKQLEWLKKEVDCEEFKKAAVKIVFIHMPIIKNKKNWYGMAQLAEYYGPVLNEAGVDLMISGHTHRNAWIDSEKSGFDYPVIICSNNDFMEVKLNKKQIELKLTDLEGKETLKQNIKLR